MNVLLVTGAIKLIIRLQNQYFGLEIGDLPGTCKVQR